MPQNSQIHMEALELGPGPNQLMGWALQSSGQNAIGKTLNTRWKFIETAGISYNFRMDTESWSCSPATFRCDSRGAQYVQVWSPFPQFTGRLVASASGRALRNQQGQMQPENHFGPWLLDEIWWNQSSYGFLPRKSPKLEEPGGCYLTWGPILLRIHHPGHRARSPCFWWSSVTPKI